MSQQNNARFNFTKVIYSDNTYELLFPSRETGLAIIALYEKIEDGTFEGGFFVEKDLHDAFEKLNNTKERYAKAKYDVGIAKLQEYFLDYNQQTQKYFFKDYAYKFCKHAKETLLGAFNPTRIALICSDLTESLLAINDDEKLRFWLKDKFKKYEPDFREQIDFLERQIVYSVDQLKKESKLTGSEITAILMAVNDNLESAQKHAKELRSAYAETRTIQTTLEQKNTDDIEINDLISDVYVFIKYINQRLSSIDKKLDRIQPKIRQLFSALNKPQFSSKIEKFILYLLTQSKLQSDKSVKLPAMLPQFQIYQQVPNFVVIDKDRQLFPAKAKPRPAYIQNETVIQSGTQRVLEKITEQDTVHKWEELILSELDLRRSVNLTKTFFQIIREQNSQVAVSVLFNIIKLTANDKGFVLETDHKIQQDEFAKNIALWKMNLKKV